MYTLTDFLHDEIGIIPLQISAKESLHKSEVTSAIVQSLVQFTCNTMVLVNASSNPPLSCIKKL